MSIKFFKTAATILVLCTFSAGIAHAETTEVDKQATQMEEIKTKDEVWNQQLKERYSLTDEQIKTLHDSGVSYPHMAMVAQLARSSQKPIEDILKMRNEQKMGWGRIAKELGVHPKDIGQSVREIRHAIRDERKLTRAEKKEERQNKKHAKKDR